jgi:hypothetical protein
MLLLRHCQLGGYAFITAGNAPGVHSTWSECFSTVGAKQIKNKPPSLPREHAVNGVNIVCTIYEIGENWPHRGGCTALERVVTNPLKVAAPVFRKSQLTISD